VLGLKEAAPKVLETILTTLLETIEENAVSRQIEKDPQRYRKKGHQSKPLKFSCSMCDFSYRFAQVKDGKTGRSLAPLVKALAIPEQVRFLDEALEPGINLCVHVSYQRAAAEVKRIGGQTMSHSTIWSRSSIVDTKSIMLPGVVRSTDVRTLPVRDSLVAFESAVYCRTLQCTQ
jgi:hypothetical protein